MHIQGEKWKTKYREKRCIMWDDTSVSAPSPFDAMINCHWFLYYYDNCVAKCAVFLQICGWIGTWELWAGSISDSAYQERSGILEYQHRFVKNEDSIHRDIPFSNILDKGYRIALAAWRTGRQLTIQPNFAKSDRKFNSREAFAFGIHCN